MSHGETQLVGYIAWQWDRYFLPPNVFLVVVVVVAAVITRNLGQNQRESARRPKSDWGKLEEGVKFSRHQSHVARTPMHWHTPNKHCRLRVGQHEPL